MKSQPLIAIFSLLQLHVVWASPVSRPFAGDIHSTDPGENSLDPEINYDEALLSTLDNEIFIDENLDDGLFLDEIAAFLEDSPDQDIRLRTGLLDSTNTRNPTFEKEISRESSLAQNYRVNSCPDSEASDKDYAEPTGLNGHFEEEDTGTRPGRRKHNQAFCNYTEIHTEEDLLMKRGPGQSRSEQPIDSRINM